MWVRARLTEYALHFGVVVDYLREVRLTAAIGFFSLTQLLVPTLRGPSSIVSMNSGHDFHLPQVSAVLSRCPNIGFPDCCCRWLRKIRPHPLFYPFVLIPLSLPSPRKAIPVISFDSVMSLRTAKSCPSSRFVVLRGLSDRAPFFVCV